MSEFGKYNPAIAGMTDLERLLVFLHGAGFSGTRCDPEDLKDREYDHDVDNAGGSMITVAADTGAAATATFLFDESGKHAGIHARRLQKERRHR